LNEDDLEGRVCYGGLDLSSTTDITAFVLVFPPRDEDDKYVILPYFWVPEETLDLRVRRDHVPYDLWEKQGYLKPPRATSSTTATSRNSSSGSASGSTSVRLPSTAGEPSRWCRTLRAWASPSFPSVRASRI
jgi:hypothetical protein